MKADYIIRGGRVIDPSSNTDEIRDIAVCGMRIADASECKCNPDREINAEGMVVTPGFIDFHCHLFHVGSSICIHPDMMVAQGTTSAVDAGSAGTSTYEAFYKSVVVQSLIRVKGFLNVYGGGQLDPKLCEDFNPTLYNEDKMERVIDKYRDNIIGLKIRLSKGVVPTETGADYLRACVELANRLNSRLGTNLRVCVHTTNPPISSGEIADCLRSGDIFCHCFQGAGSPIILGDGSIDPAVLRARKRGVIFDAANGKGNFSLPIGKAAISAGFLPDIISSDLTVDKFNMPPYCKNLPTVMSKYLTMGLDLPTLIKTVTTTPAEIMGLAGQIGTLSQGAYADITIFKEKKMHILHKDFRNNILEGNVLLVPQMTFIAGEIQFCQNDFYV